jgi:hypothetical protein
MKGRNGSALVVLAALVALVLVFAFILSSRSLRQAQLAAAPVSTVAEGSAMSPLVSPLNTPSFDPRNLLLTPSPTPGPTFTPEVFPTVVATPPPAGKTQPADSATLWYASYPVAGSELTLRGVRVDVNGQQWGEKTLAKPINLSVSPRPGLVGGFPTLEKFTPSPDGTWALEAVGFRPPLLINLTTGASQLVQPYLQPGGAGAFTWLPDGKHFVALPLRVPSDVVAASVDGSPEVVIPFPGDQAITNMKDLVGLAYSPDGQHLLDALNLPAAYQVRDDIAAQVGIRDGDRGERKVVFELKRAEFILGSLRWLSDGRAIFIVNVYGANAPLSDANQETQLWQLDPSSGQAKQVAVLGQKVEYGHEPVPVGTDSVIAIKADAVKDGKESASSMYLLNLATGDQKAIVQPSGKRLASPVLSPDGKWIAYVVNNEEYAEVRLVGTDGQNARAIAGPTALNAPVFWTK